MYKFFTILILLAVSNSAFSDVEPNNDFATANYISQGNSTIGSVDAADVYDWYKTTITSDGKLEFSTVSSADVEIDLRLFDALGNQIATYDIGWGVNETTHSDNLAAGTFYVQVYRYSGAGTYTITATHTPCLYFDANDNFNNDSIQVSQAIALNSTSTGHLGYYYDNAYVDVYDWFKVSIPADGYLRFSTLATSLIDIDLRLFDLKGNQIATYDTGYGVNESTHRFDLAKGSYFVQAKRYSGFGSYSISNLFIEANPGNPIDAFVNDSFQVAQFMPLNGLVSGHMGYYDTGYVDTYDWVKVVIPEDGKLIFSSTSDTTMDLDLRLFDEDATQLASYDLGYGINETSHRDDLKAGLYYLQIKRYSGFGTYQLNNSFIPATLPNDAESNDSIGEAKLLALDYSQSGHLGYYKLGQTDVEDWYVVTANANGRLIVRTHSEPSLEIDLRMYDAVGNQIATYDTAWGVNEATHFDNVVNGQIYYIKANRYSGFGSYNINAFTDVNSGIFVEDFLQTKYFPNPCNETLNVKSVEKINLTITDLNGKIILKESNNVNYIINTANWLNGIYFLSVNDGITTKTEKIVVLH